MPLRSLLIAVIAGLACGLLLFFSLALLFSDAQFVYQGF